MKWRSAASSSTGNSWRSAPRSSALSAAPPRAPTGHKEGVTEMRGRWFTWQDIPVAVTHHPSYLLRPYNQYAKREAWEDLKKVLQLVYDGGGIAADGSQSRPRNSSTV